MATVETHWFSKGGKNLIEAEVGWVPSSIFCALLRNGATLDQDTPENFADVAANEAAGVGYAAGGVVIANRSVTVDAATNETRLLGDPVQWASSTVGARWGVVYVNAGAKPLLGYVDFVTDRFSEAGLFRIEWPATGVLRTRAL